MSRSSPFGVNVKMRPASVKTSFSVLPMRLAGKRKRTGVQFCNFHGKRHNSAQWHYGAGDDPYTWCHNCYMASRRADADNIGLWHPTWDTWKTHIEDTDVTGHQICLLHNRPDIQALRSISVLCGASSSWRNPTDVIFISMFMLQLYWHWPMTTLWTLLCGTCPLDITRDMLQEKLQIVVAMYKDVKVVNGTLTAGKRGLSVLKNPNERRSGLNRFIELSSELDAWRRCARILAARFEICDKVVLRAVLEILSAAKLRTFGRQNSYKNIRSIRALVVAAGHTFA